MTNTSLMNRGDQRILNDCTGTWTHLADRLYHAHDNETENNQPQLGLV